MHLRQTRGLPTLPGMSNERHKIHEHELQGLKYFKALSGMVEALHTVGCQRDRAGPIVGPQIGQSTQFFRVCRLVELDVVDSLVPRPGILTRLVRAQADFRRVHQTREATGLPCLASGASCGYNGPRPDVDYLTVEIRDRV